MNEYKKHNLPFSVRSGRSLCLCGYSCPASVVTPALEGLSNLSSTWKPFSSSWVTYTYRSVIARTR